MKTGALLLVALLLLPAACSREPSKLLEKPAPEPPEVTLPDSCRVLTLDETEALLRDRTDIVILDMRTDSEFHEDGRIARSVKGDYLRGDLREYLSGLDREKPYLVYCAIGGRSRLTAQLMGELGFREIYLIQGGFNAWKAAGKPVVP